MFLSVARREARREWGQNWWNVHPVIKKARVEWAVQSTRHVSANDSFSSAAQVLEDEARRHPLKRRRLSTCRIRPPRRCRLPSSARGVRRNGRVRNARVCNGRLRARITSPPLEGENLHLPTSPTLRRDCSPLCTCSTTCRVCSSRSVPSAALIKPNLSCRGCRDLGGSAVEVLGVLLEKRGRAQHRDSGVRPTHLWGAARRGSAGLPRCLGHGHPRSSAPGRAGGGAR